jgi:WD40 repeat protein
LNEQEFPQFQLSPDGKILAGALWEKYKQNPAVVITKKTGIVLWDMQKDQTTHSLQGFYDRGSDVSFNHSGKQIASFDEYRNLRIHDVASGAMLQQFHFESDIHSMAFGPKSGTSSGYSLAVGEETGRIQVWDSGNAQIINTFVGQAGGNPVTISPNGQFLAYPSQDGSAIQISDILSGKILRNFMGADPFTEALRFSLDGQTLVISSNNNNLVFWDTSTGRLLKTVTIDGFYFDFFPHTSQPVWTTASVVQRWDETVNKLIFRFRKENPDVEEAYRIIALSSDGRLLAAGTNNALIDIWDVETGKLLRTLKGHKIILAGVDPVMPIGNIKSLAFSPYNHILASSATDCTTRIWDADTGRLLQTFAGGGPLAFSPDGNTLAYVSCGDGKVYLAGRP